MGIFTRLTDIINSNLNALLDSAEDPEKLIRLMIQEMEDTLVEVRATAAKTIADKKELGRKMTRLQEAGSEWQRKAELALAKGREDLAKAALVERAKLAETARLLADELGLLEGELGRHDEDVGRLQAKLNEAKAKQKAIVARREMIGTRQTVRRQLYSGRIEDALSRMAMVEKKLDEAEGEVEAYDLGRRKTLSEEIADLEAEAAIEEELEALKARVKSGETATQS